MFVFLSAVNKKFLNVLVMVIASVKVKQTNRKKFIIKNGVGNNGQTLSIIFQTVFLRVTVFTNVTEEKMPTKNERIISSAILLLNLTLLLSIIYFPSSLWEYFKPIYQL